VGKVLWTNVKPEINGKIWEFSDINDIVVRELGVCPRFTNMLVLSKRKKLPL
jgi:hypothetical protein